MYKPYKILADEGSEIYIRSMKSLVLKELVLKIVFSGDYNICFDSLVETQAGNVMFWIKSITKMIELKNIFELCDIWRLKNRKSKRFTFRQNLRNVFIPRRLSFSQPVDDVLGRPLKVS